MNPSLVHNAQESESGKVTSVHKGVREVKSSSERMNVKLAMGAPPATVACCCCECEDREYEDGTLSK